VDAARTRRLTLRVLGLVPARGGSRRVERKNLARLCGKTLVRRALDTALAAACFDTVALSSDDPEVLAEAEALAAVIRIRRPSELAGDRASVYDAVAHALQTLEAGDRGPFDAVAIIQCTSPFTAPEDLAGAVEMLEATGAGSVVTVARVDATEHPLKLKRMEGDRLLPFIEDDRMRASHELPRLWRRNGSGYVTRRSVIDAGDIVAADVRGYEMPPERSLDIDTATDLAFAEFLIARSC
jgi:CMP-N,N'-diacetyllegionaminic acid synthase